MQKRILGSGMLSILTALVLSACGGGGSSDNPSATSTPAATPVSTPTPSSAPEPTPTPSTAAGEAPRIVSAASDSNRSVRVQFTADMSDTATDPANYNITTRSGGVRLPVLAADFSAGKQIVTLRTGAQSPTTYVLVVTGLTAEDGTAFAAPSGLVNPSRTEFAGTVADASDTTDSDNDGLPDVQEINGWEVKFTTLDGDEVRFDVTSDPDNPDTDGDGLSDAIEFNKLTNPRGTEGKDTDRDGLSDADEVNRYVTKPRHQDSDGDGVNDGREVNVLNTDPKVADTDGDGLDDNAEVDASRDPRQAEVPVPLIELGLLTITLDTKNLITLTNGMTKERKSSLSTSLQQSSQFQQGRTDARTNQLVQGFSISASAEVGYSAKEGAAFKASTTRGYEQQAARTASIQLSTQSLQATTQEYDKKFSTAETTEAVRSETRELTGGSLLADLTILNQSELSFSISDIVLSVLRQDATDRSKYFAVTSLRLQAPETITLAPNEKTGAKIFESVAKLTNDQLTQLDGLLRKPSGLRFEVASYTLTTQIGDDLRNTDVGNLLGRISNRSAAITIDDGTGNLKYHRIATYNGFDEEGRLKPLPLTEALTQLGYGRDEPNGFETRLIALDLDGDGITETEGEMLLRIGDKETGLADDPATRIDESQQRWVAKGGRLGPVIERDTNFSDIVLSPGQQIALSLISDRDGDGLSAREEYTYSTSDDKIDSDGDGLSDFLEISRGWPTTPQGQSTRKVRSNPNVVDSDGDRLDDDLEYQCGLDPTSKDTDRDGITDREELFGYTYNRADNGEQDRVLIYSGTSRNSDYVDHPVLSYSDFDGQIIECAFTTGGYATNPLKPDTDGDGLYDGEERALGLYPNDPTDAGQVIDSDQDGLFDSVEERGFYTVRYEIVINEDGEEERVERTKLYFGCPDSPDCDNDGLPDLLEFMLKSNPQQPDTDFDGVFDQDELVWDQICMPGTRSTETGQVCSAIGFDRATFLDKCEANAEEPSAEKAPNCNFDPAMFQAMRTGVGGFVVRHGTSLNDADTDGDFLDDRLEHVGYTLTVQTEQNFGGEQRRVLPNPRKQHSDDDGLNDKEEFAFNSDPSNPDTDGDGDNDLREQQHNNLDIRPAGALRRPNVADAIVEASMLSWNVGQDDCDPGTFGDGDYFWEFNAIDIGSQENVLELQVNEERTIGEDQLAPFNDDGKAILLLTAEPGQEIAFNGGILETDDTLGQANMNWTDGTACRATFKDFEVGESANTVEKTCDMNDSLPTPFRSDACLSDDKVMTRFVRLR